MDDDIVCLSSLRNSYKERNCTVSKNKGHSRISSNIRHHKEENPSKKRCLNVTSQFKEKNNSISSERITKPPDPIEDSGIDLLQDTFVCFDDTQTLITKSNKMRGNTEELSFTQICNNTQILRQIENDIRCSNESNIAGLKNGLTTKKSSNDQILKKNKSDREKSNKVQNVLNDTLLNNASSSSTCRDNTFGINEELRKLKQKLFNSTNNMEYSNIPEDIEEKMLDIFKTSQYRKEVENLFDKVEHSIYEINSNQGEILTKTISNVNNSQRHLISPDISWHDNSVLAKAVLDISPENEKKFGNIIKKAMLENAQKVVSPGKVVNSTITCTSHHVFNELGDFYGLPQKVKDLMKMYRGIENLYEWQDECLNLPAIKNRQNLVYALPTSGGKTLVAEILILREILCWKRNVLFILPFVAIVQEKVWSLSPFAVALEFLVEEYAAGKGSYPPRKRRRKNSVYVATIEKSLGLVNSLIDTGRIDELGLIVVDELHLIGDPSRGTSLEEVLNKLLCTQENIQIIGMSATIGNLPEICKFLKAEAYTQNFRPVELVEYIKCGNELAKINGKASDENNLFAFEKKYDFSYSEKKNKIDPDQLGGLVMEVIPNESCLIFCSSKKNCENVAHLLCRVITSRLTSYKTEEKNYLKKALEEETGTLCSILNTSISYGIAYHHSGLTSDERRLIEDGFRSGVLSVICCTSTLAAGVNLPAKRVILRQPYIGSEFINLSRYKQMVGRAGRAGFGNFGESIVICTKQDITKMRDLFLSPMDQALSALHLNDAIGLRQLLLSCISLNIATTRADLHQIVKKTLLVVQETRLDIKLKKLTDKAIVELFKLGALQVNNESTQDNSNSADVSVKMNSSVVSSIPTSSVNSPDICEANKTKIRVSLNNDSKLVISKLGVAAIKGGLELTKAHLLYDDLLQAQASLVLLSCLHLLYLVTPYDISEQVKPSKHQYYKFYTQLGKNELQTAKILGLTESCAVAMLNNKHIRNVPERVTNRFYITLMLYDLWNGVTIFEVAEKFEIPRGLVQNLMTSTATFASNVVNFCSELEEFWSFAYLLRGMTERLQHCCVRELLPLMELPSVKQNRAKQLYNAGYKSLALIAKANPNDLMQNIEYMSRRLANQLIAAAKLLLLERVENLREEAEDVLDGIDPNTMNHSIIK